MPALTFYPYNGFVDDGQGWAKLKQGGDSPTPLTFSSGWTVDAVAPTKYARLAFGSKRASTTFGATAEPSSGPTTVGTKRTAFRTNDALTGSFAAGTWSLALAVIALTALGQQGRWRVRVWAATASDGTGARELTAATLLSTTGTVGLAQANLTATWAAPAITLTAEFLFVDLAWEITTAASGAGADVLLRRDGTHTKVVTADWTTTFAVVTKVVRATGGDYTTLQAALTAELAVRQDLVSRDERLEIALYADASQTLAIGTAGAIVQDFITDAAHYVRIYVVRGNHHRGKWDAAQYRLDVTNQRGIDVRCNFVRVEGIQVLVHTTSTLALNADAFFGATTLKSPAGAYDIRFINCYARGHGAQAAIVTQSNHTGFAGPGQNVATGKATWINCIAEDFIDYSDPARPVTAFGFSNSALAALPAFRYYNCETRRCYRGFRTRDYADHKNCRGVDNVDTTTVTSGPGAASTKNTSSKRPDLGDDFLGTDGRHGVMGLMVDPIARTGGLEDWTPAPCDTEWKGQGVNLSNDAGLAFAFDAAAQQAADGSGYEPNRPGPEDTSVPWTIGALEQQAASAQDVHWLLSGAVTSRSARVRARLEVPVETLSVYLVVSSSAALPALDTRLIGPVAAGAATNGVATFDVPYLVPGTTYYYAVQIGSTRYAAGRTAQVTTFPDGPANVVLACGTCWEGGTGPHDLVTALLALAPAVFLFGGDLHYRNVTTNDQALVRAAFDEALHAPAMQRLVRQVPLAYVWSDHDFGGGNSIGTAATRPAAEAVYREVVPSYPLMSTETAHAPIYHSFVVGRVRVILTDLRSNKSAQGAVDDATKTMLGAAQKAWFKGECLAAALCEQLIVWVSEVAWLGPLTLGADHWGGYTTERTELSDFFVRYRITNLVRIEGDVHSGALDDGTNDAFASAGPQPQHATLRAAPLSQSNATLGTYSATPVQIQERGIFGTIAVVDTGAPTITVTLSLRDRWGAVRASVVTSYDLTPTLRAMPLRPGLLGTLPRSALPLHWRARDLSLTALTGQAGVLTRAATTTATDAAGQTISVGHSAPAITMVDLTGDAVRDAAALRLGLIAQTLYLPFGIAPRGITVYTKLVARAGLAAGANALVWLLGAAAGTAPALSLTAPAANTLASNHAVGAVTRTTASQAIAANDVLEVRTVLYDDGSVLQGITRNGGAEAVTAATAALAFGAAWSDLRLYLGSVAPVGDQGFDLVALKVGLGQQSLAAIQGAF